MKRPGRGRDEKVTRGENPQEFPEGELVQKDTNLGVQFSGHL